MVCIVEIGDKVYIGKVIRGEGTYYSVALERELNEKEYRVFRKLKEYGLLKEPWITWFVYGTRGLKDFDLEKIEKDADCFKKMMDIYNEVKEILTNKGYSEKEDFKGYTIRFGLVDFMHIISYIKDKGKDIPEFAKNFYEKAVEELEDVENIILETLKKHGIEADYYSPFADYLSSKDFKVIWVAEDRTEEKTYTGLAIRIRENGKMFGVLRIAIYFAYRIHAVKLVLYKLIE